MELWRITLLAVLCMTVLSLCHAGGKGNNRNKRKQKGKRGKGNQRGSPQTGGDSFACTESGEQFRYEWNKCQYWECVKLKQVRRPQPRVQYCPPGWSVPKDFQGGADRTACTVEDRTCVGEMQQTHLEDMSDPVKSEGPQMAENLKIKFNVGKDQMALNLTRNDNINPNAKIILGKNGKFIDFKQEKQEDFAFYTDTDNGASIAVWKLNNTRVKHKFKGNFYKGNNMYKLEPRQNDRAADIIVDPEAKSRMALIDDVPLEDTYYVFPEIIPNTNLSADSVWRPEMRVVRRNDKEFSNMMAEIRRSAGKQHYIIETLLCIDYAIFNKWWGYGTQIGPAARERETVENMKFHYAYILNGVDLRYRNVDEQDFSIGVRFVAVYIATTRGDAPWTENEKNKDVFQGKTYVEADDTLTSFTRWLNDKQNKLPKHDQGALFTGYLTWSGLSSIDGSRRRVFGLGDIGGICDYWRACLSEDLGEFGSTQTLAHEIAHGLAVPHDGKSFGTGKNNCNTKDQYVMASSPLDLTKDNYKNAFRFSSCSVTRMRTFLDSLTAQDRNCLFNDADHDTKLFPQGVPGRGKLPGQLLTDDQQCQLIHGKTSYYCAGHTYDADICRQMVCYSPRFSTCFVNADARAATGTTCGNKKWCIKNECVKDQKAPADKDFCRSGDFKWKFVEDKTCREVVRDTPWKCYEKSYRDACCASCERIRKKDKPNCLYGDKSEWCSNLKKVRCYEESDKCCARCASFKPGVKGCEYGDRATWCATQKRGGCYQNYNHTCCDSCARSRDDRYPGCEWGNQVSWCHKQPRQQCYIGNIAKQCCATTCRSKTGLVGCMYADKAGGCTLRDCKDSSRLDDCCYTCRHVKHRQTLPPPPPATTTATTTTVPTSQRPTRATVANPSTGIQCTGGDKASWCRDIHPSVCYVSDQVCCTTCTRYWRPVKDCSYGDKRTWCDGLNAQTVCKFPSYSKPCCALCSQSKEITTTSKPTPPTTPAAPPVCIRDEASWCSKIRAYDCYYVQHTCCKRCKSMLIDESPYACRFGDRVSWGHMIEKSQCYSTDVRLYCCDTCERYQENIPGCEFGDRRRDCAQMNCKDPVVKKSCCKTCSNRPEPKTTITPFIPTSAPAPPAIDHNTWCPSIFSGECYNTNTRGGCAKTCKARALNIPGCEFGDYYTWCYKNPDVYCFTDADKCCKTCRGRG